MEDGGESARRDHRGGLFQLGTGNEIEMIGRAKREKTRPKRTISERAILECRSI